jgi:spermidine synthase
LLPRLSQAATTKAGDRLTRRLALVFFLSGFAGLVYQVAWQRLLTIHYGVGAVSTTLIVSVYMFGLGLGSLVGGALAERSRHRLRLYAAVELCLGLFGALSLPLLHALGRMTAGSDYLLSGLSMAIFLSIPTLLMGITLPLITKIYSQRVREFRDVVSFLYFINTLGAALGALFCSFILISLAGLDTAIYLAASINLLLVVLLVRATGGTLEAPAEAPEAKAAEAIGPGHNPWGRLSYLLVVISGFLAIGYEIIWFRLAGVLVKASPYAFSSVLFVYLLGIALGSYWMQRPSRRHLPMDDRSLFFLLQGGIGIYSLLSIVVFHYATLHTAFGELARLSFRRVLHPPLEFPAFDGPGELLLSLFALTDVIAWPVYFVLVPTLLMGASFPLIVSLAVRRPQREGMTVGTVYFFNVAGNLLGGVATGFLLLPWIGTERTLLAFSALSLGLAFFATHWGARKPARWMRIAVPACAMGLGLALFPGPGELYLAMHFPKGKDMQSFVEEGIDGVVVTYQDGDRVYNYIGGLHHGGRPSTMFKQMTVEAIVHATNVERSLVVGFGTGTTTEVLSAVPDARSITLVELSDTLLDNLRKMEVFRTILDSPRLKIVIDDGRRYLLRSEERFDLIFMDPIRTTTSYSNNLYSRQFFELALAHLEEGGVMMLWTDDLQHVPRTFASVFPHVRCSLMLCIGSNQPLVAHPENLIGMTMKVRRSGPIARNRNRDSREKVLESTRDASINEDWKPWSEYYLGTPIRRLFGSREPARVLTQ